jgi:hypothetical protein
MPVNDHIDLIAQKSKLADIKAIGQAIQYKFDLKYESLER